MTQPTDLAAQKELRAAWDDMIASLERARDAIDQPDLMPPPQNARNLAEAYHTLYEYYRFNYIVAGESRPRVFGTQDNDGRSVCDFALSPDEAFDFKTVGGIFDDETNPGRKRAFDMRSVMDAVIDQDGGDLERWQQRSEHSC